MCAEQNTIGVAAVEIVGVDIIQILGNGVDDFRRKDAKDALDNLNGSLEFIGRKIKLACPSDKNRQGDAVHEKIGGDKRLPGRVVLTKLIGGWHRNGELRR